VWLLTTVAVFSFMAGIFHPYYTVVLAPSIAALVGIGTTQCWRHRETRWAKAVLVLAVASTSVTSVLALVDSAGYHTWLRWAVGATGVVALCWVLLGCRGMGRRWAGCAGLGIVAVAALGGPTAYSLTTVARGNSGAMPIAGPVPRFVTAMTKGVAPVQRAEITAATAPGFLVPGAGGAHRPHFVGCSLMESGVPDPAIVSLLQADADAYTWVGATVGSSCAAGYQLASGHPVMPVGGFNGTDPAPDPDEFRRLVLAKRVHYFIVTNPIHEDKWGHLDSNGLIQQWVQRNFTPMEVGRVEVYDLTK
jgi:4-amino-4-deoxy-L-arabinose transferase-like glycosyltransferase